MKKINNARRSAGGVLYWAVGILLVLVMLSAWMVCGLFAKYLTSDKGNDTARVAATGVVKFEVLEHKVKPDATEVYILDKKVDPVKENNYGTLLPGFDIPKDPFVRLELKNSEVDYYLYVTVIESENFPKTVKCLVDTDNWEEVDPVKHIYKYIGSFTDDAGNVVTNGYFDAGSFKGDIYILKDNKIYVSEHYAGESFSVSFEAKLVQVD